MRIPDGILPRHYTGAITGAFASSIINTDSTSIHFTAEEFLRYSKKLIINYYINITNICDISDSDINLNHGVLFTLEVENSNVKKINITCAN
ncbi:hypothetical protein F7396_20170 [Salmonella enterica]|nr:hypothetical protein [Salmonella enterica subsp. enterica serovar Sandiego]ECF1356172.1 hypothetical protein [Salmonella enterica subsp. enterica serovar Sandiego]ECZ0995786.1 hypothetical protein [Salmonella enterica]EHJ0329334.1 hypothetical protein [Salmonella enterica]